MHIIITSSLLWSFLISVETSKPHMPSKMPSMLLKFLIQPKWKVNAVWCIRANHPTAAPETRKWLHLILQHSLTTKNKNLQQKICLSGAFERNFGPESREYERTNLPKFKCAGGGGGGMMKPRIDLRISKTIDMYGTWLLHLRYFSWLLGEKRQIGQRFREWVCNLPFAVYFLCCLNNCKQK